MFCLVVLSLNATFASDNDTLIADDGIIDDESLAISDEDVLSTGANVVTKDNFNQYFDGSGALRANFTGENLTFKDDISNVGVKTISFNRTITISGDNATLTNISIDVKANNIIIKNLTINVNNATSAISIVNKTGVEIENTKINFNAVAGFDGVAIDANLANNLKLIANTINYVGATTGTEYNSGIRIVSSNNTVIKGNKFNLKIVSAAIPWIETPAGSGIWVSSPVSEGIVIDSCDGAEFKDNNVTVNYNGVVGGYDTIYAVDFTDCDNLTVIGNNITGLGHSYIYGIIVSGDDIEIKENNINVTSDSDYADGIDIEGSNNISVDNNVIVVKSPVSAYPIYTGMTYGEIFANYTNNKLIGEGYYVIGMSLADNASEITNNDIKLTGNYTLGIASKNAQLIILNNNITLVSSQKGNLTIRDSFGVDPAGIKINNGHAIIVYNNIVTPAKGVAVYGGDVDVVVNNITVVANEDADAYAIYTVNAYAIDIDSNIVNYTGATKGTGINNAVYISNSNQTVVEGNTFDLTLVSSKVPWAEVPAGSGNWVSSPVSEGIVIVSSNEAIFKDNNVTVNYNGVVGTFDTIYAVDLASDNLIASGNNITALGHSYIYGILVSGNNFTINDNYIKSTSDIYYANGIDVEGPAKGIIKDNTIIANAPSSSYPIYTAMSNGDVSVEIVNNTLSGEAYFVCALEVSGKELTIENNTIDAKGNYTIGIGSKADQLTVANNNIALNASNKGNETISDSIGVGTAGIKVASGSVAIGDNNIAGTNKTVELAGTNITIKADNQIKGHNAADLFKVTFYGFDGKVLANQNVTLTVGTTEYKLVTDANGVATLNAALAVGTYEVVAHNPVTNETSTYSLTIVPRFSGNDKVVMDYYDGTAYKVLVYGDDGKTIAGASVTITIKGKSHVVVTDANGYASYVVTELPGTYTISAAYAGDSVSNSVKVNQVLKASKKTTTIKKSKTKKFTLKATLKTSAKKAIKGKKVTFKLNGKKYTAKTNKKGVVSVTIKKSAIKKLKAKKYTVTITYVKDVVKCYVKVKK